MSREGVSREPWRRWGLYYYLEDATTPQPFPGEHPPNMKLDLPEDFFLRTYSLPASEMNVLLEHRLTEAAGENVVVGSSHLDYRQYSRLGLCNIELQESPRPILTKYWGGPDYDKLYSNFEQSLWKIEWNNSTLYALDAQWTTSCGSANRTWVVAPDQETAGAFILDVARKTNDPGETMLVFRHGHWDRSADLYESVQRSSFEDLVLPEELLSSLRTDFKQFLHGQDQYEKYGLAWRRGALLVGPPGNGKTHCVRALVKEMDIPSLYVQSLAHPHLPSDALLKMVFDRARELRPCVLILEDLDALIDTSNQSFFLNQLDGLEKNIGLIVLATTNHPERIDPAISQRPSRFDRKYYFELPEETGRLEFLLNWQQKLADCIDWPDASVRKVAATSQGFSFAYLKELMVSALMTNLANEDIPFTEHISVQLALLKKQMTSEVR